MTSRCVDCRRGCHTCSSRLRGEEEADLERSRSLDVMAGPPGPRFSPDQPHYSSHGPQWEYSALSLIRLQIQPDICDYISCGCAYNKKVHLYLYFSFYCDGLNGRVGITGRARPTL